MSESVQRILSGILPLHSAALLTSSSCLLSWSIRTKRISSKTHSLSGEGSSPVPTAPSKDGASFTNKFRYRESSAVHVVARSPKRGMPKELSWLQRQPPACQRHLPNFDACIGQSGVGSILRGKLCVKNRSVSSRDEVSVSVIRQQHHGMDQRSLSRSIGQQT